MSRSSHLDWLLDEFTRATPGVDLAVVVSSDGLRMASSPGVSQQLGDQLAAAASGLASLARGTARLLDDGSPGLGGLVSIGVPSAAHSPYERMPKAMKRDWPGFAQASGKAICKQPQSDATLDWLGRMFGATPLRRETRSVFPFAMMRSSPGDCLPFETT